MSHRLPARLLPLVAWSLATTALAQVAAPPPPITTTPIPSTAPTSPFTYDPYGVWPAGGVSSAIPVMPQFTQGWLVQPLSTGDRLWLRSEYLIWWARGMSTPPLVTTSPFPGEGVLGEPDTTILYGGDKILEGHRSGLRFTFGWWLGQRRKYALEADIWGLENKRENFTARSDELGNPVLARPFFNINPIDPDTLEPDPPAREDSELVSYRDVLAGRVSPEAASSFKGGGLRMRINLCCIEGGGADPLSGFGPGRGSTVAVLVGYRYARLKESLAVVEDLNTLGDEVPAEFFITDSFQAKNSFNGVDVGFLWTRYWNRLSLELLAKMALGNNKEKVTINGSTTRTFSGVPFTDEGGLLALSSNIGEYSRDEFAIIPELGATLSYQITPRLRATIGYTFVYWSQVVRPGDIIDLDVNPELFPPDVGPIDGPLRPRFSFVQTDYWAQGVNLGIDFRW